LFKNSKGVKQTPPRKKKIKMEMVIQEVPSGDASMTRGRRKREPPPRANRTGKKRRSNMNRNRNLAAEITWVDAVRLPQCGTRDTKAVVDYIGKLYALFTTIIMPNLHDTCDRTDVLSACHAMFGTFTEMPRRAFIDEISNPESRMRLMALATPMIIEHHGIVTTDVGDMQRIAFDRKNARLAMQITSSRPIACPIFDSDLCMAQEIQGDRELIDWLTESCRSAHHSRWKDQRRILLSRVAGIMACHGNFSLAKSLITRMMCKRPGDVVEAMVHEIKRFDGMIGSGWCLEASRVLMDPIGFHLSLRDASVFVEGLSESQACDCSARLWIAGQLFGRAVTIGWIHFLAMLDWCSRSGDATTTMILLMCIEMYQGDGRGRITIEAAVMKAVLNARSPIIDAWVCTNKPAGYGLGNGRSTADADWPMFANLCINSAFLAYAEGRKYLSRMLLAACGNDPTISPDAREFVGQVMSKYISCMTGHQCRPQIQGSPSRVGMIVPASPAKVTL
jgi:hypothetical protein